MGSPLNRAGQAITEATLAILLLSLAIAAIVTVSFTTITKFKHRYVEKQAKTAAGEDDDFDPLASLGIKIPGLELLKGENVEEDLRQVKREGWEVVQKYQVEGRLAAILKKGEKQAVYTHQGKTGSVLCVENCN